MARWKKTQRSMPAKTKDEKKEDLSNARSKPKAQDSKDSVTEEKSATSKTGTSVDDAIVVDMHMSPDTFKDVEIKKEPGTDATAMSISPDSAKKRSGNISENEEDSPPKKKSPSAKRNLAKNKAFCDTDEEDENKEDTTMADGMMIGIGLTKAEETVEEETSEEKTKNQSPRMIGVTQCETNEKSPSKKSAINKNKFLNAKKGRGGNLLRGQRGDPRSPVLFCVGNAKIGKDGTMHLFVLVPDRRGLVRANLRPSYAHFLLKYNVNNANLGILSELGADEDSIFDIVDDRGDYIEVPDPRGKTGPRRVHAVGIFQEGHSSDEELKEILEDFKHSVNKMEYLGGDSLDTPAVLLQPKPVLADEKIGDWIGIEQLGEALKRFDDSFQPFTGWGADKLDITRNFYAPGTWTFKAAQYFGCPLGWLTAAEQEKAKIFAAGNRERRGG